MSQAAVNEVKTKESQRAAVETLYTICPVMTAANRGSRARLADEEFRRAGAKGVYLRSLENNAGWIRTTPTPAPNLFRDGGAIPTIRARADLTKTKLIGLTWAQQGGQILVKTSAGIRRVARPRGPTHRPLSQPQPQQDRFRACHGGARDPAGSRARGARPKDGRHRGSRRCGRANVRRRIEAGRPLGAESQETAQRRARGSTSALSPRVASMPSTRSRALARAREER